MLLHTLATSTATITWQVGGRTSSWVRPLPHAAGQDPAMSMVILTNPNLPEQEFNEIKDILGFEALCVTQVACVLSAER